MKKKKYKIKEDQPFGDQATRSCVGQRSVTRMTRPQRWSWLWERRGWKVSEKLTQLGQKANYEIGNS